MAVWDQPLCALMGSGSPLGVIKGPDLPSPSAYRLPPGIQFPDGLPFCVPPSLKRLSDRRRNINLLPIGYAFRPRLRGRLTQGRLALPWKPWAYGERVSHPFYRYSCQHYLFPAVHRASRLDFGPQGTLPYHARNESLTSVASVPCLAPLNFRRRPA